MTNFAVNTGKGATHEDIQLHPLNIIMHQSLCCVAIAGLNSVCVWICVKLI